MMGLRGPSLEIIVLSSFLATSSASLSNSTKTLHETLLDGYNRDIRPCLDCLSPLNISVSYHFSALIKLDELEGELHSVGYLEAVWLDERLTWNPLTNGVGSVLLPPDKIWVPPLLVSNPSREISHLNSDKTLVRVLYNGTVIWHPGDVFKTTCSFDIYRYPFDNQVCRVTFTPWSYLGHEVRLFAPDEDVDQSFYRENGQWELQSLSANDYIQNEISFLTFRILFQRRSKYFVVNIILPIFMLAFLNCLAFVIPVTSGERISYTVTLLLSFAVFMTLVSDNVPKTSSPMSLLCYYLAALFTGSVLVMVVVMFNMRLYYRKPSVKMSRMYICIYKMGCRRKEQTPVTSNKIEPNYSAMTIGKDKSENGDDLNEISWQDLAEVLDKLGFLALLLYFITISIAVNVM